MIIHYLYKLIQLLHDIKLTKNLEIYYFIQTEEREDHSGDVGSEEMEYVNTTGTYILKPIIIIHHICVEVKCYYSVLCIFM